jgi:hypothetical protein
LKILILSAACCFPRQATIDDQAKRLVEQVTQEMGISADIVVVPGSAAIYSKALSQPVKNTLMQRFSRNELGPAILINGEIVAYGLPKPEELRAILARTREKVKEKDNE